MIKSNRDRYLPFHTTEDVVKAIEVERKKQSVTRKRHQSRSKIMHEVLREGLIARGHKITGLEYRVYEGGKRKKKSSSVEEVSK